MKCRSFLTDAKPTVYSTSFSTGSATFTFYIYRFAVLHLKKLHVA